MGFGGNGRTGKRDDFQVKSEDGEKREDFQVKSELWKVEGRWSCSGGSVVLRSGFGDSLLPTRQWSEGSSNLERRKSEGRAKEE